MSAIQTDLRAHDERAARYQAVALNALSSLSSGDPRPQTLHRLRTHLRRLQAYLELVGENRDAKAISKCVSRLSRLRTLQAFEQYLTRLGAPESDLWIIRDRIRTTLATLERKDTFWKIEHNMHWHSLSAAPADPDWMPERLHALRRTNANVLRELTAKATANPRRKTLHALRLRIKSIRYQEEWALDEDYARPVLVNQLKRVQSILGRYEERAQFRKLARALDLESYAKIVKGWRRARTHARAIPHELTGIIEGLSGRRLRLVGVESRAGNASLSNLRHAVGR